MTDPKCKKCGHKPCPGCQDWCDVMLHNIYCPSCDEVVCEQGGLRDGIGMTCTHCSHQWELALVAKGRKRDDVGVDACCDMKCEWDRPDAEVQQWCEKEGRK
jgi:hypothetical protein